MRSIRLTDGNLDGVLSAGPHSPEISHERYGLILSRVQLVSRFFSVVILLWVGVEFACWPWPISGLLALERVFAAGALWTLGTYRFERRAWPACRAVLVLLLIPASLILGGEFVLAYSGAHLEQQFGTQAYIFSPFLLAATLSIFPLSMRESALLAAPTIAVAVLPMVVWPQLFAATSPFAVALLLVLIAGISAIASFSQLKFLVSLVKTSATDGLTGAVTRKVGERMLGAMFAAAQRKDTPLSILFIDLDRFKSINDRFGHGAGDDVLRGVTAFIREVARRQDVLVRWGGEELVLIMPESSDVEIAGFVSRLAMSGIGHAPDEAAITASIGGAERKADRADSWAALVEAADRRMYAAKAAGRNCYIGPGDNPVTGLFGWSQAVAISARKGLRKKAGAGTSSTTRVPEAAYL